MVSFEGEAPFLPRVITPHMNDWWWGARASTHKKVSGKPLLLLVNVLPAYYALNHALNRLLRLIYGYFSINTQMLRGLKAL